MALDFKARTFWVTVYKTDKTFFQEGKSMAIHCWHVNSGNFGMNTYGEVIPLPGAAAIQDNASPPNLIIVPDALDPQGTVYPSPTQFGDKHFKAVTKIKDMVLLEEFYVNTDEYNANVVTCNPTGHN